MGNIINIKIHYIVLRCRPILLNSAQCWFLGSGHWKALPLHLKDFSYTSHPTAPISVIANQVLILHVVGGALNSKTEDCGFKTHKLQRFEDPTGESRECGHFGEVSDYSYIRMHNTPFLLKVGEGVLHGKYLTSTNIIIKGDDLSLHHPTRASTRFHSTNS